MVLIIIKEVLKIAQCGLKLILVIKIIKSL